MVEIEFIISIFIATITATALVVTFIIYHVSTKPALSIDGPRAVCTSEKNTRTYGIDLMYVPGNPAGKTRNDIDTIVVTFTVHNRSQHILRNIELRYIYSNTKVTKKNLLEQNAVEKLSLAPNTSKRFHKEHKISFTEYDAKSHYLAVLASTRHHFAASKVFSTLHAYKETQTPEVDYE